MIVGIDVAKASFDAAWEADGRLEHRSFAYTEAGFAALIEATPAGSHYVMEATGIYHARLALWLYEAQRQVSVVNPLVIATRRRGFSRRRRRRAAPAAPPARSAW